jgi:hypothetical protein
MLERAHDVNVQCLRETKVKFSQIMKTPLTATTIRLPTG